MKLNEKKVKEMLEQAKTCMHEAYMSSHSGSNSERMSMKSKTIIETLLKVVDFEED